MSRSFFERMLDFAMGIGMKGLGYISVLSGMELKGPIVKFLSVEKQQILIDLLGLKEDDTLFFICDTPKMVDKLAGQIRTELGERLDIIDRNSYEMCFITDYPMYGITKTQAPLNLPTIHSPCPRVKCRP